MHTVAKPEQEENKREGSESSVRSNEKEFQTLHGKEFKVASTQFNGSSAKNLNIQIAGGTGRTRSLRESIELRHQNRRDSAHHTNRKPKDKNSDIAILNDFGEGEAASSR